MAYRLLILPLSLIAATAAAASHPDHEMGAPAADAGAKYCLKVEPVTGSRMETTQCRTREDWARLEVDVDHEWADNGVRVIA